MVKKEARTPCDGGSNDFLGARVVKVKQMKMEPLYWVYGRNGESGIK